MSETDTVAATIRFPEELYERLKVAAHVRNTSVNGLVVDLLYDKYGNNTHLEAIRKLIQEARDEGHIQ